MGTAELRNLLTSLCVNSPWKYVVFWKLKHQDQMLLTWEDGHCDYTKQREPFQGMLHYAHSSEDSKIPSFEYQSGISDRSCMDFSIGFAIGYMSCLQYALGEGVIGRAALIGKDNWVFFDNSVSGEFCSSKPEFPEEWHLQVTAGIKTILLIPLLPHGILQLGSFEKVVENLSVVSEIKEKFNSSLYKRNLVQSTSSDNLIGSSSMRTVLVVNKETKPWCTKLPSEMQFEASEVISTDNLMDGKLSNNGEPLPPFAVQNTSEAFKSDLPAVPERSSESDLSNSSFDPLNLSVTVNQHTDTYAQETICDLLAFSYMYDMDEVIHCSLLYGENDDDVGLSGETSEENANLPEDILEEPLTVSDEVDISTPIAGTFFGFPLDCELRKDFRPYFSGADDGISWDWYEPNYYKFVSPADLCSTEDLISSFDPPPLEYCRHFDGGNHEDLLQDVIPSIFEQLDDNTSCTVLRSKSSITSSARAASSSPALSPSEEAAQEAVPLTHGSTSFFTGGDDFRNSICFTSSSKGGISTLTETKKTGKRSYVSQYDGVQVAPSKRARANNGHKSRPRDRQLIQDRLNELRDFVPNGEKCSIDSLLDKAIKHMQFLTSVSEQAEKLSHTVDEEIAVDEKLVEANNQQKCGSWAFEMENDLKPCPITVKDLPRPGSMLIEMVCDEQELFFEITKVISNLGLAILKSVMETNSGNTWAQFIAEAPRGFAKMEIFFPLMQLLQRHRSRTAHQVN